MKGKSDRKEGDGTTGLKMISRETPKSPLQHMLKTKNAAVHA